MFFNKSLYLHYNSAKTNCKMKNSISYSLTIIVLVFIMYSCSDQDNDNNDQKSATEAIDIQEQAATEDFYFFLPSPIQIAHILKKSGLLFSQEWINDPSKYDQYQTRTDGLLNLGVYTGDLAYCILNDRTEESLKYINSIKKLADKLDLSEIYYSDKTMTRIESAVNNKDSLVNFIISTQENLSDYAYSSNQLSILMVTFAGAWIETVYIGAHADNESPEKVGETLAEEMGILKNLKDCLESKVTDNPEISYLIIQLKDFEQKMYSDDGTNKPINFSSEQIEVLKKEIAIIRNNISNN